MIDELTREAFAPHIGSDFTVRLHGHEDVLTLVEVNAIGRPYAGATRTGFSLLFQGASRETLFDQQILALEHPVMGTSEIMLTPIGRARDGGFRYEAVFN